MNQAIGERLRQIRGTEPLADFASRFGVSKSTLARYENGQNQPDAAFLKRICEGFGINPGWLLVGEGDMRRDQASYHAQDDSACVQAAECLSGDFALVPRYDIEVSAGGGSILEDDTQPVESMAFRRVWLKRMGLDAARLALVNVRGDSMEPTLADGDMLLVDLRQTGIIDGAIHVLRNNNHLLIKRLQIGLGNQVIVRSDNRIYRELETTRDQLTVIGRVVWRGGKM